MVVFELMMNIQAYDHDRVHYRVRARGHIRLYDTRPKFAYELIFIGFCIIRDRLDRCRLASPVDLHFKSIPLNVEPRAQPQKA